MSGRELDLESIDPAEVTKNIRFHDQLNPKLWDGTSLRLEVRVRLMRAALAFYKFLEVQELKLTDIVITGSNAAFNFTDLSDIDIHLIVDYDKALCPDIAENFFTTKKTLWNLSHKIVIRGHGLEMYVEDTKTPAYSNGVYSLLRGVWIKEPAATKPTWDDAAVIMKTESIADQIDALLDGDADPVKVETLLRKLKVMRQSGLAAGGEFSTENLAYKSLRALGYLDRLWQAKEKAQDADLSLPESQNKITN
jgi:hypothetical protein